MSYVDSWQIFFKDGDRVMALPCRRKPRLYIVSEGWKQRWNDSEFYPAFRPRARVFRLGLRLLAAGGLLPSMKISVSSGLRTSSGFLKDIHRCAVLVGVEGPTQKLIVRCLDENGRSIAYVKYGEPSAAAEKIKQEAEVLARLASIRSAGSRRPAAEIAPRVLWSGTAGAGVALMVSAVEGEMLEAMLPASVNICQLTVVNEYLNQLRISDELFEVDEHPAIVRLREQVTDVSRQPSAVSRQNFEEILEPLRMQKWPVVIQHGDFTPWNVLRRQDSLCAIDWEEGTVDGFPHFDLIYCILQTAFLIHRVSPDSAVRYVLSVLSSAGLSGRLALSLTKLAALDARLRFELRKGDKAALLQQFRLSIIKFPNFA